jgi:hypothetical protein
MGAIVLDQVACMIFLGLQVIEPVEQINGLFRTCNFLRFIVRFRIPLFGRLTRF